MRCSPEFRARVAKQADLARRGTGRGYTGQLFFTYGEVMWILTDLQKLHNLEQANVLPTDKPETENKSSDTAQVAGMQLSDEGPKEPQL